MERVGTVVVGAGVIGLACGRALALARHSESILIVDRNASAGQETTSRNSSVIHAGLYYPSGSLKARLCVKGRKMLYEYARQHSVNHGQCGKLLVATTEKERLVLPGLVARARAAGLTSGEVDIISGEQARAMEPGLRCVEAVRSTVTGWIDVPALVATLEQDLASRRGVDTVYNCSVTRVDASTSGGFVLETTLGPIACSRIVNACGLGSTAFAHGLKGQANSSGLPAQTYFAKGSYVRLLGAAPFKRHIYPLPADGGLGVHATIGADGQVRFGPDVEWMPPPSSPGGPTAADMAWPPGLAPCPATCPDMYRAEESRVALFREAIRRYYPSIEERQLAVDYCGVRPKLSGPGQAQADFWIRETLPGCVHLMGIESPGLTSALAAGEYVAALLSR